MKEFECKCCNYTTKRHDNYFRHCSSKKHQKNVSLDSSKNKIPTPRTPLNRNSDEKFKVKCGYCKCEYSRKDSLTRHLKKCQKNLLQNIVHKNEVKLLRNELKHKDDSIKYEKEQKDHYIQELYYYKKMLSLAGGLVKKTVNSLTYAIDNYSNAPAIKAIDLDAINSLEKDNNRVIEDIISAYKHKTINKYIGALILEVYKKDEPKEQSVWNSDSSRLTYLIKEMVFNKSKSSNWIVDKKGIKTAKYIVEPILDHIRDLAINYQRVECLEIKFDINSCHDVLETNKLISAMVNDIDDRKLHSDILKYLSTHLYFKKTINKK